MSAQTQAERPAAGDAAREAVEAPPDASLAIVGPPGAGKSRALALRAARLRTSGDVVALAPSAAGAARLARTLAATPGGDAVAVRTFGELAHAVLDELRAPGSPAIDRLDDVRGALRFEASCAELFALAWHELASAEVDAEVTGMRSPERFARAAYRLARKLRSAMLSPEDFRAAGMRGAVAFYAKPPNLAGTDLIAATSAKYRDSLRAAPAELETQRAREVDLVKILARAYARYADAALADGALTAVDAVYEAVAALRARPGACAGLRAARYAVDDAQDCTGAELALLAALRGDALGGVTLAGDAAQSTRGFAAGARGGDALRRAATTVELPAPAGRARGIEAAARVVLASPDRPRDAAADDSNVALHLASNAGDEARHVAAEVARLIAAGTPPGAVAVVAPSLACAHVYVGALLAAGVPVDVAGAAGLEAFPIVEDALATLRVAADPFRHDALLRTLAAPWLRLCDATLGALCGDAASPQQALFAIAAPSDDGGGRWDRRRDLRLGRHVVRGDVDPELPPQTRERLVAFRAARERWSGLARALDPPALARAVLADSVLATLAAGPRGAFERGLVLRLLDEVDAFARRDPLSTLEDFLDHAERAARAGDDLRVVARRDVDAVLVGDVEAVKGEAFDAVFAVDVHAGAWPRYYVPDAFLFAPSVGMLAKDNVGDGARSARTAKFTWASHRLQFREKYVAEERRALYCAMTRARHTCSVSASGRITRGVAAPELLEELRAALAR